MNTAAASRHSFPVWLALLVALIAVTSVGRWWMEGRPAKLWRSDTVRESLEYCPDGMAIQIDHLSNVLRGQDGAGEAYLSWIRNSHQSSTYLVSVLCAPLVVLGLPAAGAFVTVSLAASLVLVVLLWRLCREVLPDAPGLAVLAVVLFLVHPATSRCFARPQTDGLMAMFALSTVLASRRVALRSRGGWTLAVLQCLAVFVKIHALSLLLLAPAVAFLHGARGRALGRVLVQGTLVPAVFWAVVFAGLDVFPTIGHAWQYKGQFYREQTLGSVAQVVCMSLLPLLFVAAWRARWRGLDASLWLTVAGFLAILWVSQIPPKSRFQYPLLAPLVFLTVASLAGGWAGKLPRVVLVSWFAVLSGSILLLDLYGRYLGPTRDLKPLDAVMIHLF